MKPLILLILLLSVHFSNAQKTSENPLSYKYTDCFSVKIGDTLSIGKPSGENNSYKYIREYNAKDSATNKFVLLPNQQLKAYVKFLLEFEATNSKTTIPLFVIGSIKNKLWAIDVDGAVRSNELIIQESLN